MKRKRVKHELSFEQRLLKAAREAREKARSLPLGKEREILLRSAEQSERALEINRWISSPGLKPPDRALGAANHEGPSGSTGKTPHGRG